MENRKEVFEKMKKISNGIEYIFNIFICTLTIISLFGNGQYISIHPLAIGFVWCSFALVVENINLSIGFFFYYYYFYNIVAVQCC